MRSINEPDCVTEYTRLIPINHEVELQERTSFASHLLFCTIKILLSFLVIKDKN